MESSCHQALYKQPCFKSTSESLSSFRQSVGRTVRWEQSKQRDLFISCKRFKLKSLPCAEELFSEIEDEELVKENVKLLRKGKKLQALSTLCSAFSRRASNADIFLSCDGFQSLLACFKTSNVEVLQNAAWCAVNLSAGATISSKLIALGPTLIQFLKSSDILMQELCAWALGNLAGDSPSNASVLQGQGCIPALMELLLTRGNLSSNERNESVLFALINLAQSSYSCIVDMQENRLFELTQTLFKTIGSDSNLSLELGWLVSSVFSRKETFSSYPAQYAAVSHLLCQRLTEIVEGKHDWDRVVLPFIHCLANVMGMDGHLARSVLENNVQVLTSFHSLLSSDAEIILKESLRALFNGMGGLCSRVLITFDPKLLHSLLSLCQHSNTNIALQALAIVGTMTKTSNFVDSYLVKEGILTQLRPLIQHGMDVAIAESALAVLNNLAPSSSQVEEELKKLQAPSSVKLSKDRD